MREDLDDTANLNTGRVLGLVNADVQCLMEVEDRITRRRINDNVLTDVGATPCDHAMLIDSNDERGIPFQITSSIQLVTYAGDGDTVGQWECDNGLHFDDGNTGQRKR